MKVRLKMFKKNQIMQFYVFPMENGFIFNVII